MKKVLILVWNDYTFDKRVSNISRSLRENGFDVTVIAAKPYKGLPVCENGEEKIIRIPQFSSLYSKSKNIANEIKLQKKLEKRNFLKKLKNNKLRLYLTAFLNWLSYNLGLFFVGVFSKPDIVYANDLDTLTVGYIISKICRAKLIFDSHELWFYGSKFLNSSKLRQQMWRILQKMLIYKVDSVIVTTNLRAKYLEDKYNLKKVNTIRNCSRYEEVEPTNLFREEFGINEDIPILVYHGAIHKIRGIYSIVDAIKEINNTALVFIGGGADIVNLKNYIKEKDLEDRVFVKDAVPPDQVLKYISSADIGIQLFHYTFNHYTVISNKLLECIMAGLAIIANDYPEMKKIVVGDELGVVVDYKDIDQVRLAINRIINDKDIMEKYKGNSKKVRCNYSWELEEKKLLQIINNLK